MIDKETIINFPFLDIKKKSESFNIMIILNRPIIFEQYKHLRKNCDFVICADGAANRLYDFDHGEK